MVAWSLLVVAIMGARSGVETRHARAVELVQQLGSEKYRDREKAAVALLAMGFNARQAVLDGTKSTDSEIQERCRKLFPQVWRAGLDARVAEFANGPKKGRVEGLPGIASWMQIAGDSPESRTMYATMVMNHAEKLIDLELKPETRATIYLDFVREHYQRTITVRPLPRDPSIGPADPDTLLFLFLGGEGPPRPSTAVGIGSAQTYTFINNKPFADKLRENEAYRRLFAAWLARERYSLTLRRGIDIAAQNKVTEVIPSLLSIARDPGNVAYVRATALLGLGEVGNRATIKELEPFFNDKLQVANVMVNGQRGTVEIRDLALAASVRLTGQAYTDFGFERKPPPSALTMSYTYFAFGSDEKRQQALTKWAEWSKANLNKK